MGNPNELFNLVSYNDGGNFKYKGYKWTGSSWTENTTAIIGYGTGGGGDRKRFTPFTIQEETPEKFYSILSSGGASFDGHQWKTYPRYRLKFAGNSNTWYWSNFTWQNSSTSVANIHWRIYYNNSRGLENVTPTQTIILTDNSGPIWYNNATIYSSPQYYSFSRSYGFEVKWNSTGTELGYDTAFIEHNFTGTLTNYSTSRTDNVSYYNYTGILAGTYQYKFYANNSNNKWTPTDAWYYQILNAPPQWSSNQTSYSSPQTYSSTRNYGFQVHGLIG